MPLEIAEEGDGRTIDARIIPYGESATICDPPDYITEQERFAPGAFDKQINAAHRVKVWLTTMHEQGLRGIVGHGETLEDRDDGVYADVPVARERGRRQSADDGAGGVAAVGERGVHRRCSRCRAGGIVERVRGAPRQGVAGSARRLQGRGGACVAGSRPIELPRLEPLPDELLNDLRGAASSWQRSETSATERVESPARRTSP